MYQLFILSISSSSSSSFINTIFITYIFDHNLVKKKSDILFYVQSYEMYDDVINVDVTYEIKAISRLNPIILIIWFFVLIFIWSSFDLHLMFFWSSFDVLLISWSLDLLISWSLDLLMFYYYHYHHYRHYNHDDDHFIIINMVLLFL